MAQLNYTDAQINDLILGIYKGDIDPLNLPDDLYKAVGDHLNHAVETGFGRPLTKIEFGTPDHELLADLKQNIYMFSAARTFQQTSEMSDALVNEKGELRTLKEFKEAANEIYVKYNGNQLADDPELKPGWIDTEYNTAITQANNAKKWQQVEKNKDILPYLRRVAVGDELECDICGELDGITAPVDDPIWGSIAGAAHFNCRCLEEQLDQEEGEAEEWDDDEMAKAVEKSGMPDEFKYNPGIKREVYSSEGESQHPYFSVPKENQEFAEQNFGLPIPDFQKPNPLLKRH